MADRLAHASRSALPVQPAELRVRDHANRLLGIRGHFLSVHDSRHRGLHPRGRGLERGPRRPQADPHLSRRRRRAPRADLASTPLDRTPEPARRGSPEVGRGDGEPARLLRLRPCRGRCVCQAARCARATGNGEWHPPHVGGLPRGQGRSALRGSSQRPRPGRPRRARDRARPPRLLDQRVQPARHQGRRGPRLPRLRLGPQRHGAGPVLISIVVPTLNEAANLGRLLPDLHERCREAEVILVDGGSEDATRDVVTRFPRVQLVTGPRGRARQMNAGARVARGDTLLFLHADTRLPDGALGAVAAALDDARVVGGRFDVSFDSPRAVFRMIAGFMNVRSRWSRISTGDQAIFVRRSVFEAMGGYPDIALMEDIELCRCLKRRGRLAALRARVTTSARKWEREGALRTMALMWALRFFYMVGVSPDRLHRWYYR